MNKIDQKIKLAERLAEWTYPDDGKCGYEPEAVTERIGAVLLDLGTVARTGSALSEASDRFKMNPSAENWSMLQGIMFLHQNNTGDRILDIDPDDVLLPGH